MFPITKADSEYSGCARQRKAARARSQAGADRLPPRRLWPRPHCSSAASQRASPDVHSPLLRLGRTPAAPNVPITHSRPQLGAQSCLTVSPNPASPRHAHTPVLCSLVWTVISCLDLSPCRTRIIVHISLVSPWGQLRAGLWLVKLKDGVQNTPHAQP